MSQTILLIREVVRMMLSVADPVSVQMRSQQRLNFCLKGPNQGRNYVEAEEAVASSLFSALMSTELDAKRASVRVIRDAKRASVRVIRDAKRASVRVIRNA